MRPPRHVPKVCELFFRFCFSIILLTNNAPARRRSAGRGCRRDNINGTGHRESDKSRLQIIEMLSASNIRIELLYRPSSYYNNNNNKKKIYNGSHRPPRDTRVFGQRDV